MSVYPQDLYPGCPCYSCDSPTWNTVEGFPMARMSLCPECGDKRCRGAVHHADHGRTEPPFEAELHGVVAAAERALARRLRPWQRVALLVALRVARRPPGEGAFPPRGAEPPDPSRPVGVLSPRAAPTHRAREAGR